MIKMKKDVKKIIILLAACLLLFSMFTAIATWNYTVTAQLSDGAELTGNITDKGLDTDGDGKYNYLEIAVEINVYSEGYYQIEVHYLLDPKNTSCSISRFSGEYFDEGIGLFNLSFFGPEIYASKFNVSAIGEVLLCNEYWDVIDYLPYIPLSQLYNYSGFDCGAVLTGKVYDEGVDTDGDGFFNKLQIGVEINVTDAAEYKVYVSTLYGTAWVNVYNYSTHFLYPGNQILNVSLSGVKIYASHGNVSTLGTISLSICEDYHCYTIQSLYDCPLSRTYNHNEFDILAFFTGTVFDEGIDEDGDGLFDYLRISVEVNITDAGHYFIHVDNLLDNGSIYFRVSGHGKDFDVGLHLVNFSMYGPRIYAARINPTYIGPVILYYYSPTTGEKILLEEHDLIPLLVPYYYYEFESHAFLTGKIYDRGVDTDADGLFDYLEVGVEVNVTEAGTYQIAVSRLTEEEHEDNQTVYERSVYCYQSSTENLTLGTHVINFTFPGSMIAYYHLNPESLKELSLRETYCQLSYFPTVALSKRYNYTQFNSPMNDMQINFTVYPDATVEVSGLFNRTRIYPPNYYQPLVNATLSFSTNEDLTTGSINGTVVPPRYPYSYPEYWYRYPYSWYQFPYNSTTINFKSEYQDGMLNAQLNATVLMPPAGSTTYPFNSSDFSFISTYSDGIVNIHLSGETEPPTYYASQFPFNATDVSVLADYGDNKITGNITFHTVSGFPLGDVIVYFSGNKTEISFTGYINVMYGEYYGMTINETTLENILLEFNNTIPGHGEGSLYDITDGIIECTQLNTTKTPLTGPLEGARINYNATISGNFTKILATYLTHLLFGYYAPEETYSIVYAALDSALSSVDHASLTLNYYHEPKIASVDLTLSSNVKALWNNALQLVPTTVPPEYRSQCETWLKIANATAHNIQNAYIEADYSSIAQQLNVQASLTANITQLKDEVLPILPEAVPPDFRELAELCMNNTFCTLKSLNITCNYVNGIIDFDANWLLKGDFKAELNRIKNCYMEYLSLTSPWMINWQIHMLNVTEIDIGNFKADMKQGKDWATLTFKGLKIYLTKEELDPIRFKIYKFFNLTSSPYESPREFEKLKVTIKGGSNATHTILLYAPPAVPALNITSLDGKTMTWENTTISSLRDLVFNIAYQEVIDYLGETYYIPIFTNSTVSNFNFDPSAKRISFNVTGATGRGFCNVTIPRALLYAALDEWIVKFDGVPLSPEDYNVTENAEYVFIYLNYSHSSHLIEIEGTWIITEFPPNMLPPILMIITLIAAIIAVKQRKKLGVIKTKSQKVIHTIVSRLYQ